MNTAAGIAELAWNPPVATSIQGDLFDAGEELPLASGIFADVVFDRPLDHAFTYAVANELRDLVGVGKRVQVPFGKGDRPAVGYCVRVSDAAPPREVKAVLRVLDDEALLDDNLMRLTRWMADYYLCGWGQVLNAVIPAGAKERAGMRTVVFLDAVPETELPQPWPTLTTKQTTALDYLRSAGRPEELRRLVPAATSWTV